MENKYIKLGLEEFIELNLKKTILDVDKLNYIRYHSNNFNELYLDALFRDIEVYVLMEPFEWGLVPKERLLKNGETITIQTPYIKSLFEFEEIRNNEYTIKHIEQRGCTCLRCFVHRKFMEMKTSNIDRLMNIIRIFEFVHIELTNKRLQASSNSEALIKANSVMHKKQPLSFLELFKHPYSQKMEGFKANLRKCSLIGDDNRWREFDVNGEKVSKNDIGKFFNWLYYDTVVMSKTSDKTNESICFCNEFGISVYKDKESKPIEGRSVTSKLINNASYDPLTADKYNNVFKEWLRNK